MVDFVGTVMPWSCQLVQPQQVVLAELILKQLTRAGPVQRNKLIMLLPVLPMLVGVQSTTLGSAS